MPKSQIRWYAQSQSANSDASWNPDEHSWNVLIINRADKIKTYQNRLEEAASPIIEERNRTSGKVPNSNLSYKLISIQSRGLHPSMLRWKSIFEGKTKRDRELRERTKTDTLEIYVDNNIAQLSS